MYKTLVTALVTSVAIAGSASAMGNASVDAAQETLSTYGFNVDADTLSTAQVRSLNFLKVDSDLQPHRAEARIIGKIRAILN